MMKAVLTLCSLVTLWILVPGMVVAQDQPATSPAPAEKSVKPGINEKFLDPDLQIDEWVERWEVESREVYVERDAIAKACEVRPGMQIADIGAGTGLFTRIFSEAVGESGRVFAVDISPRFLEHITTWTREENVGNVTTVLCRDNSVMLPPASVDVAFLCDTYHHFEYPASSSASIRRALKPGGMLVVVDFERIPGKSREWVLGHVRAGKDVVRKELEAAGFAFKDEVEMPGLVENYLVRFIKK